MGSRGQKSRKPSASAAAEPTTTALYSADGMTHLDPEGRPPVTDAGGRLTKPFVLHILRGDGTIAAKELWGVGLKLPDTPAAFKAFVAEVEAERARKHPLPKPELDSSTAFKVTATGKRKRKADAELTPAQLKRRQRNMKRNAEKKRSKT